MERVNAENLIETANIVAESLNCAKRCAVDATMQESYMDKVQQSSECRYHITVANALLTCLMNQVFPNS